MLQIYETRVYEGFINKDKMLQARVLSLPDETCPSVAWHQTEYNPHLLPQSMCYMSSCVRQNFTKAVAFCGSNDAKLPQHWKQGGPREMAYRQMPVTASLGGLNDLLCPGVSDFDV